MDLNIELVKVKERLAGQRCDIDEHDKTIGKLEERVRALEVRVAVLAAISAGVGATIGGVAGSFFGH